MNPVRIDCRKRRDDLGYTRGDGYRYGKDVIGQKGRAGCLSRHFAQVIPRHNVRPTPTWISVNGLLIGNRYNCHQGCNSDGDWESVSEGAGSSQHQNHQDFLGGVGGRGECV